MNWRVGPPFRTYALAMAALALALGAALNWFGSLFQPLIYLSFASLVALTVADIAYTHRRKLLAVAAFYAFLAAAGVAAIELAILLAVVLVRLSATLSALDLTVAAVTVFLSACAIAALWYVAVVRTVRHLPQRWETPLWGQPLPSAPGAQVFRVRFGGPRR